MPVDDASPDPNRNRPTWGTVVSAVCLAIALFVWYSSDRAERHVSERAEAIEAWIETERVYRERSRAREVKLLYLLEHASCEDIDELREAIRQMREEIGE